MTRIIIILSSTGKSKEVFFGMLLLELLVHFVAVLLSVDVLECAYKRKEINSINRGNQSHKKVNNNSNDKQSNLFSITISKLLKFYFLFSIYQVSFINHPQIYFLLK